MSTRIAAPARQKIVPAFTVKKLEGEIEREIIRWDKHGKKYIDVIKAPAGYLVQFPSKGHSIRVRDEDELKRLGFDRTIPLIDESSDDDEAVGGIPNPLAA